MRLDHEMIVNTGNVQWIKFYPYHEPKDNLLMAACEIKFNASEQLLTLFDYAAQRLYNYFNEQDNYNVWVEKINWS